MKNPFRLMTIFTGIIGGCAAFLVIYILAVYPNINKNPIPKDKDTAQNSAVMQADNDSPEIISVTNTLETHDISSDIANDLDTSNDIAEPETQEDDIPKPTKALPPQPTATPTQEPTATPQPTLVPTLQPIETPQPTEAPQPADVSSQQIDKTSESQVLAPVGDMVWLPATGEKYHKVNNCGRMNPNKARSVSLEYAISEGYESCDKCF